MTLYSLLTVVFSDEELRRYKLEFGNYLRDKTVDFDQQLGELQRKISQCQEGMVMCVEALIGVEGGKECVKLEEQVLITADGYEQLTTYPLEDQWL